MTKTKQSPAHLLLKAFKNLKLATIFKIFLLFYLLLNLIILSKIYFFKILYISGVGSFLWLFETGVLVKKRNRCWKFFFFFFLFSGKLKGDFWDSFFFFFFFVFLYGYQYVEKL